MNNAVNKSIPPEILVKFPTGVKSCSICTESKLLEDFYVNRVSNVLSSECKKCQSIESKRRWALSSEEAKIKRAKTQKEYNEANVERGRTWRRKHHLRVQFGLTMDDYDSMLAKQDGVCGICKREETAVDNRGRVRMLSVDHCHTTGKVRGLLCVVCNQALRLFREDINTLLFAIDYIQKYK